MKHPTTKLGAIFFALCCIFFGCSTTTTKNAIIMEDPKSTGVIFEEEEPVDLVALADAFEVMIGKRENAHHASATEPLPAPRPPTPVEIAELVSDNQQVLALLFCLIYPSQ